jgi:ribonuclease HI
MGDKMTPIIYFDGGSRGNPGVAAGAAVLQLPNAESCVVSQFMKHATNNEAEYTGLIIGLQKAKDLGIETLEVKGDSQLVINQVNGLWKVKSSNLQGLYNQACRLVSQFNRVKIEWVPRKDNHLADAAVNECIDKAMSKGRDSSITPKTIVSLPILNQAEPSLFDRGELVSVTLNKVKKQGMIVETPEKLDNGKIRLVIEID